MPWGDIWTGLVQGPPQNPHPAYGPNVWPGKNVDPIVGAGPEGTGLHRTRSGRLINNDGFYVTDQLPRTSDQGVVSARSGPGSFWRYDAQTRLSMLKQLGFNLPNTVPEAQKNDMLLIASKAYVNHVSPSYWNQVWKRNHPAAAGRPSTAGTPTPPSSTAPPTNKTGGGGGTAAPAASDPMAGLPGYNWNYTPYSGPTYTPGTYTEPAGVRTAAQQIVDSLLGTQRTDIQSLQRAATDRAAARAELLKGFGSAQADLLKSVGPATQQTYDTAAGQSAAFGKGFSDAYQQAAGASEAQANQLLSNRGMAGLETGPAVTAGADAIFGLGGNLPAQTLTKQGAAFTAAANELPNAALGSAKNLAVQALAGGENEAAQYNSQLLDLARQEPGLLAQWLNTLGTQDLAKFTANETARQNAADLAERTWAQGQTLGQANAAARAQYGTDVANVKIKQAQYDQQTWKTFVQLFGIDPNTNAMTPELRRVILAEKKYKDTGGKSVTPKLQQQYATDMEVSWGGDVTTNSDGSIKSRSAPNTYQEEIIHLVNNGAPLSLAQKIMNTKWTRPGYDRAWHWDENTETFVLDGFVKNGTKFDTGLGIVTANGRPLQPYQARTAKGKK